MEKSISRHLPGFEFYFWPKYLPFLVVLAKEVELPEFELLLLTSRLLLLLLPLMLLLLLFMLPPLLRLSSLAGNEFDLCSSSRTTTGTAVTNL